MESLDEYDTGIELMGRLYADNIEKLREEYVEKWEVPEKRKYPHQPFIMAKRNMCEGDIDEFSLQASTFIKGINSMVPIVQMLHEDSHSATAAIIRSELFSFLKTIIGTASVRTPLGILSQGWWDEGTVCIKNYVVDPSMMIAMLGGKRCDQFDNAFDLFLKLCVIENI